MAVARNLLRVEYKQGSEDESHPQMSGSEGEAQEARETG